MNLIVDEHQFAFFEALPPETRPGTVDDFHNDGKPHLGMPFLLLSKMTGHYVLYFLDKRMRAGRLKFFIDLDQIFIFTSVPQCVTDYHEKLKND